MTADRPLPRPGTPAPADRPSPRALLFMMEGLLVAFLGWDVGAALTGAMRSPAVARVACAARWLDAPVALVLPSRFGAVVAAGCATTPVPAALVLPPYVAMVKLSVTILAIVAGLVIHLPDLLHAGTAARTRDRLSRFSAWHNTKAVAGFFLIGVFGNFWWFGNSPYRISADFMNGIAYSTLCITDTVLSIAIPYIIKMFLQKHSKHQDAVD